MVRTTGDARKKHENAPRYGGPSRTCIPAANDSNIHDCLDRVDRLPYYWNPERRWMSHLYRPRQVTWAQARQAVTDYLEVNNWIASDLAKIRADLENTSLQRGDPGYETLKEFDRGLMACQRALDHARLTVNNLDLSVMPK